MADGFGKAIARNFAQRKQNLDNIRTTIKRGQELGVADFLNPLNAVTIPQRALVGTARSIAGEKDAFGTAFGTEFGGNPSQFLDEQGAINTSGTLGAFGGLALDVLLDPLTIGNPLKMANTLSKVDAIGDINKTIRATRKANIEEIGRFAKDKINIGLERLAGPEKAKVIRQNINTVKTKFQRNFIDKTAGVDPEYIGLIDRFNNGKNSLKFESQDIAGRLQALVPDAGKRNEIGDIMYLNISDTEKTRDLVQETLSRGTGEIAARETAEEVHALLMNRNQNQQQVRDLDILRRGVVENNDYLRRITRGGEDAGQRQGLVDYLVGNRLIEDQELANIMATKKFKPSIIQKLDAMNKRQVPEDVFKEIIRSDAQGWYQINPAKLSDLNSTQVKNLEKFMDDPRNLVMSKTGIAPDNFDAKLVEAGVPNVFSNKNFGGYEKDFSLILSDTLLKQKGVLLQNELLQNMSDLSRARKDFMMVGGDMVDEVKAINPSFEKDYVKLSDEKFGKFKDSFLHKSVADNVGEIATLKEPNAVRDLYNSWNGAWKKSNTALNFGSHVNQLIGNTVHMDMMGFRLRDIKHIKNSWGEFKSLAKHEVAGTVPEKGTNVRTLFDSGLFQGTVKSDINEFSKTMDDTSTNELGRLYEIFMGGRFSKIPEALNSNLINKMSNIFGLEDNAARFFMFEKLRAEEFGSIAAKDLNPGQLSKLIQDTKEKFVNYDRSGKWVDALAKHPVIGSPFIRFAVNNTALWAKEAIYNPWKYGKYRVMVDQFNRWSAQENGIPEEQYEQRVAQSTPDYMDLRTTLQFGSRPDGTRYVFNGKKYDSLSSMRDFGDGVQSLLRGGPLGDALIGASTGRDTFSGQEITQSENLLKAAVNTIPTPFIRAGDISRLTNALVQPKGKFGEDKPPGLEVAKRLTGINISVKNPDLSRRRNFGQINKEIRARKREIEKEMINTEDVQRQQELREEFLQFKADKLKAYL